ncbi:permease [Paucilactobacillus hokkaidonensis JCM 18461]|uniref:Probable membrane transporter protein n=2 Tax=Paucilactobacillus hokkaidonensis TaxID=1193095 RepID=A0A0A1GYV8_9LACO|nr:permease [Paucilactobacillus hokkaidonensis]BAP85646.1 permease [Paucilactobacillus hokkaidonensis JCM 18461]
MIETALLLLVLGVFSGTLGSLLGIGGGMIVIPVLTVMMGLPIRYAIGASIIAVIATSSGATIAYLRDDLLNLRVAMFLEIATTVGAITGAVLTGIIHPLWLETLFGCFLLYSCYNMIHKLWGKGKVEKAADISPDKWANKLKLNGTYYDKVTMSQNDYEVTHVPGGFAMMYGAGLASGLLGIGSGVFKVIAMDTIMKMPLKPSSATSNLMMGVTAAASATVYFFDGAIKPEIAAPLALGILVGAAIGTRIMQWIQPRLLRIIFVPILFYMGLQMFLKGFGVSF